MINFEATEAEDNIHSIKEELVRVTATAARVHKLHKLTGLSTSQMKGKVNVAVTLCHCIELLCPSSVDAQDDGVSTMPQLALVLTRVEECNVTSVGKKPLAILPSFTCTACTRNSTQLVCGSKHWCKFTFT